MVYIIFIHFSEYDKKHLQKINEFKSRGISKDAIDCVFMSKCSIDGVFISKDAIYLLFRTSFCNRFRCNQ